LWGAEGARKWILLIESTMEENGRD
jgi:hypothetical protein